MMEKQLELLHKQVSSHSSFHLRKNSFPLQQQILEKELQQKNVNLSMEQPCKSSSVVQTTTRATSPIKREVKTALVERATSPAKQPTASSVK